MTSRRDLRPPAADVERPRSAEESAEEAELVLVRRARALAQPLASATSSTTIGLMTFTLYGGVYAVESRMVREVCRLGHLAVLPGAEPPIAGLTLWRGELLPVVDLGTLFGRPGPGPGAPRMLLVLDAARNGDGASTPAGLAIDAPGELRAVPESFMRRPPDGIAAGARAFIQNMLPDGVLVLDAGRVCDTVGPESS